MKLDKKKDVVNSMIGACCSFFLMVLIALYTYQKIDVWYNKRDNIVM